MNHPLVAVHAMTVRAFDRADGRLIWEYGAQSVIVRIALATGRVFVLDDRCRVHCLVPETGAVLGIVAIDSEERSGCALVADGETLYVATTKSIVAVDGQGRIAWRANATGTAGARAGLALPGNVIQPDFTG